MSRVPRLPSRRRGTRSSIDRRAGAASPVNSRRRNGNSSGGADGNSPSSRKKKLAMLTFVAKGFTKSAMWEDNGK